MTAFTILILLCATFSFDFSIQDKIVVHINAQTVEKLRQQAVICEKETGVPAAVLKKIIEFPLDNNEPNMKFYHCICFNRGITDKDGHMIVEGMATFTAKNGTQEDYIERIKECNNFMLENHLETLYAVGDCIHSKVIFSIDD